VAKSTDVKVRRRADVENVTIKIEMSVKSDAKELKWFARRTDEPAASIKGRLLSDLSRGLVLMQNSSVFLGLRTRPLWRNQL